MKARHQPDGSRRGFTLIELLLALALVGLLMVGLNTFVFSMTEIWGRNREPRLFDQHVRMVTRYIDEELRKAARLPTPDGSAAIVAQDVRQQDGRSEELLTFELTDGSRRLNWPERPLPEVVCALTVRPDAGLLLLWHSRLEVDFDDDPPREMLLSPLATAMAYEYYDATFKRWETSPTLRTGTGGVTELPQRLRVTFQYENLTRDSLISLPVATAGVPPF